MSAVASPAGTTPGSGQRHYPRGFADASHRKHASFNTGVIPLESSKLVDCIFDDISSEGSELSHKALLRLMAIYKQNTLEAALSLVDKGMVQKLVAASGRSLYLVEGSGTQPYVCFKHYCPCYYYYKNVINRPEALACKHILAARIGEALCKIETLKASNEDYINWMRTQEDAVTGAIPTPRRTPKASA
eukprot:CAMPEP_0179415306 /NCGR_PEP_ID=MMETSP0799-20121207/6158_1 /TAXON_ID=46947 /ORGANISM="Geminigera cryophila, Strain CCMP2564" /LENGTH=188 /DNA_ID=CAMNT_0021188029 /DNA_START=13 /DNA_END=579 /DNA_ORIENTATION=-